MLMSGMAQGWLDPAPNALSMLFVPLGGEGGGVARRKLLKNLGPGLPFF